MKMTNHLSPVFDMGMTGVFVKLLQPSVRQMSMPIMPEPIYLTSNSMASGNIM